jgi:acyl-CoA thioester hydrolase
MSEQTACYLGSVNRWECDENDHLNVRFFGDKINQAVAVFIARNGLASSRIEAQHIRFVKEARVAAPLRVDCFAANAAEGRLELLALMRQSLTGEPLAAITNTITFEGSVPELIAAEAPDWARPRGIDPQDLYPEPTGIAEAEALGFRQMGGGVVRMAECDSGGELLPHHYLGRISDGMPNLWGFESGDAAERRASEGELGGAVLEYRLTFRAALREGDVYRHYSGIRNIGSKTQHMVHLVFDERRDRLALSAEGIALAMDLETRKAVPISARRLEDLKRLELYTPPVNKGGN